MTDGTQSDASPSTLLDRGRTALCRLQAITRLPSTWIAVLVMVHLGFGGSRLIGGAIVKRQKTVSEYQSQGPAWHFRICDEETQRLAAWLIDELPRDQALLYEGERQGVLKLLAPLVFPAILVRSSAVDADGTAAGRPVFGGQPPWLPDNGEGVPVVTGDIMTLHWSRR